MYESLHDDLPAPPNFGISVAGNTDTQTTSDHNIQVVTNAYTEDYDLPVVTTDISMNTNPAYATTSFGEAQQPDSSYTYVNVVDDNDYI